MPAEYFDSFLEEYGNDVDYLTEKIALSVTTEIRARMRDLALTQERLAARMNVSPEYTSKLLNCNGNLTLRSLAKIAVALESAWEIPRLQENRRQKTTASLTEAAGTPKKRTGNKRQVRQHRPSDAPRTGSQR